MTRTIFILLIILSAVKSFSQNVGIGTVTPQRPLHLYGSSELLRIQGGQPWIGFMNNTDPDYRGFIFYPDTSLVLGSAAGTNMPLVIAPNNSGLIYATSQGYVGIGKSDPQARLHIETSAVSGEALRIDGTNQPALNFYSNAVHKGYFSAQANSFQIGAKPSNVLHFFTNDILRLSILDNGNVGVGETNPSAKLEVNGFSRFGSAVESTPKIKMKTLTGTTAPTDGGFTLILHGLDASKIIGVTVLVESTPGAYYPPNHTINVGKQFEYFFDNTRFEIINKTGNSGFILNRPIKILITYEE